MNPTLAAILGPLEGATFTCGSEELSIGRESSNDIPLADPLVSRKHCMITKERDQFKIIDLNSHNGVSINGLPTKERVLEHGDQIQIGDSIFLFLSQTDESPSVQSEVETETQALPGGTTARLRIEEAIYMQPEKLLTLPPTARMTRDLNTLFKVSRIINNVQGMQTLQTKIAELSFEAIPAQRAAILRIDSEKKNVTTAFTLDKRPGYSQQFQVSNTVLEQVLQEKVAILANDVAHKERFSSAKSLNESQIHSLLCIPLVIDNNASGVFYLDTTDPEILFDEGHLQLATALAGITAPALDREQQRVWLHAENQRLRAFIQKDQNMLGEAPAMELVYQIITRIAPTTATVLICGESGTGKELAALAIHLNSPRATKPFVAINCAALAESLQETELFGHEKGAFTGAIFQKKGKLEMAHGGTVFLDEIAETAPSFQGMLLRVLQEKEFQRVGGTNTLKVDVRWIAATNQDLEKSVEAKKFREDLYFRLKVVTLTLPPLRERREDIPTLANHFVAKYGKNFHRSVKGISAAAMKYLVQYDWPGNIRELENTIQRAVIFSSDEEILTEDLPENLLETGETVEASLTNYHQAIQTTKKQIIQKALDQSGGNYTQAATLLGLHPVYLYRLTRNLKLK
jgi:transcriptional regulator with GAF, ATPase, and Fis domain